MPPIHDHEQSDAARLPAEPRVSVLVITYNQQDYIAAALQGAVDQRADFPFEIVIGEDCSTDMTRAICLDIQQRHPDKIRILWSAANLGFQRNFTRTQNACRGGYVAVLEGDDLWTDPGKLARQVAALDKAPSVDLCVTRGRRLLPDGSQQPDWDRGPHPRVIGIAELAAGEAMMAPTASIIARRTALASLPAWIEDAPVRDSFLLLGLGASNGVLYLPQETCLYRVAATGSWSESYDREFDSSRVDYARRMLRAYDLAVASFGIRRAVLRRRVSSFHLLLARDAFRRHRWVDAIRHCLRLDLRYLVERGRHRLSRARVGA